MTCPPLRLEDGAGLAATLRAIDCRTGEAAAGTFDRLLGSHGALLPALTLLLTLVVGLFAVGLLTGRARLGIAALTPRMLTIGLALTFATSWIAYQRVVWTLATGAPDQIATVLAGTDRPATDVFAERVDRIVATIAEAAEAQAAIAPAAATPPAGQAGQAAPAPVAPPGLFTPGNLLWGSGLLLLLGTVGVLVTAKVALALLLAVGPLFIVLVLFSGTRGLFEGWLKAVVATAIVPMFATVIGGATLAMLTPLVRATMLASGDAAMRTAVTLFLATSVYCALMVMALATARGIVAGWRLPFGDAATVTAAGATAAATTRHAAYAAPAASAMDERVRAMIAAMPVANDRILGGEGMIGPRTTARGVAAAVVAPAAAAIAAPARDPRLRGVTGGAHRPGPIAPVGRPQ